MCPGWKWLVAAAVLVALAALAVACVRRRRPLQLVAKGGSVIPKIIHQTWKSSLLPPKYQVCQESWKRLNPDMKYQFYDDNACEALVRTHYPQHLAA